MTEDFAPRPRTIQAEWALHRGVRRFVRRALAAPHLFANHDRSAKQSERQHIGEKERGALAGFPDTTLWWAGGVFPCELKRPGRELTCFDSQAFVGNLFATLGYRWACVNSVAAYGEAALAAGAPLATNWRFVAAHEDELVAADIRKQQARAATAPRRGRGLRRGGVPPTFEEIMEEWPDA